ncbi:MAG: hypothetical protein JW829_21325, partial [Pirellulales bacterium]|nr:hypothetical protein [Pirellulales bacterium]
IVPLDCDKTLRHITLVDRMQYGQIFLLGASVNTSTSPAFPNIRPSAVVPPVRRIPAPVISPTRVHRTGDHITLENAWLRCTAQMQSGPRLENLQLVPFAREVLSSGSSLALISVLGDNGQAEPMQLKSSQKKTGTGGILMECCWSLADPEHELTLGMDVTDTGSIRLTPILHNRSSQPWMASLRCPEIQGCRIFDIPDDRWYLLGTVNGVLSHMPISIQREHGTHWPLPLFDLFAKQAGGGLGVYLDSWDVFPKTFKFAQSDAGTDLAIQFHDLVVPPGQSLILPPVVLMAHLGDWHDLFNAYRGPVADRTPSDSGKRIQDIFTCRRDYPLGGTGYLFDPLPRRYTPRRLAAESNQAFGGIDMIDISGWAYSLANGRVGDYLSNDLGGLDELCRMVEQSHADGLRVGLYFEGYLLDRRSNIAKKALPNWQMIDKDGQPLWWAGGMEFYTCPGVAAWRNALSGMIAKVAAATGADAVYVDQYGLLGPNRTCWSPDHGHPVPSHAIREERAMLQAIRHALDQKTPNVAIYIEYTPPDCMMDLVDAAFDYGMSDTAPPCRHAADLPLYRFAFPQLASFEMISSGIRPIPVEPDDLHRCLFHGLGIWIKGRAESWYTSETKKLAQQAYRIFKDHADVFRSRHCDPMIPTLQPNLFANRFASHDQIIVTLYNAGYGTIAGDLVQIPIPRDWTITGLLPKNRVDLVRNADQIILRGTVNPRTTALFLLHP